MLKLSKIDPVIKAALQEDLGPKDITSAAVIPAAMHFKADITVNQEGILCGIGVTERVFRLVDENIRFLPVAKDGEVLEKGREVAYIEGGGGILSAERTALNLLSHLSGIATKTRQFVDKVKGTSAKILDTRKTTPGLRLLEKYAVATGGGVNHRMGLYDQVLIKDNHLRVLRDLPMAKIVEQAKKKALKRTVIGIEVKNLKEFAEAIKTPVDYILLDNMDAGMVAEAVRLRKASGAKMDLEVSGGVNIDNVLGYAKTGVERISVGCLTHDAPALDISLDIVG